MTDEAPKLRRKMFGVAPAEIERLLSDRDSLLRMAEHRAAVAEARVSELQVSLERARADQERSADTVDTPAETEGSATPPGMTEELSKAVTAAEMTTSQILDAWTSTREQMREAERLWRQAQQEIVHFSAWRRDIQPTMDLVQEYIEQAREAIGAVPQRIEDALQPAAEAMAMVSDGMHRFAATSIPPVSGAYGALAEGALAGGWPPAAEDDEVESASAEARREADEGSPLPVWHVGSEDDFEASEPQAEPAQQRHVIQETPEDSAGESGPGDEGDSEPPGAEVPEWEPAEASPRSEHEAGTAVEQESALEAAEPASEAEGESYPGGDGQPSGEDELDHRSDEDTEASSDDRFVDAYQDEALPAPPAEVPALEDLPPPPLSRSDAERLWEDTDAVVEPSVDTVERSGRDAEGYAETEQDWRRYYGDVSSRG